MTVSWNGDAVMRKIDAAIEHGCQEAAEELLAATRPRVPVDTGALRDSGRAEDGWIIFDAPHAAIVHERLDLKHDAGEAKFLENAANANRHEIAETLARDIRRAVT